MSLTLMADSTQPLVEIPSSFRAFRNRGVALYHDGRYAIDPATANDYPRHVLISVTGDAAEAEFAEVLDVERFDATASQWPEFRERRDEWCIANDSNRWPKVYCSIDPDESHGVAAIERYVRDADQRPTEHYWIAWYTPGGFIPTAHQVTDEIWRLCGIDVPASRIWACQFRDVGHYDLSVVYQSPEW